MVDALVGGGLILPRSDDHHCGLAGFEGFTSSGLIHAGHGVAAFVEVTHLLEEGLVLLGIDGDLAIGGVDAGAIALQERSPARSGRAMPYWEPSDLVSFLATSSSSSQVCG